MRCATHPGVETSLRCAKCGKPICPGCMVQTPVGARCGDCAQLRPLPTYHVPARYYLRGVGAGLGAAIGYGILWGLIVHIAPFYLNLLLAPLVGFAVGEVISISVNRKRGKGLAIIAGIAAVAGYVVSVFFPWVRYLPDFGMLYSILDLLALAVGAFVAASRLR